jgi:hypothetical protein
VTNRINNGSLWLPIEPFASYVIFFMISLFFVVDILICRIDSVLIPVAMRCKACVFGRSRVRVAGSNLAGGMYARLLGMLCVLSVRCLCDWPITRPEEYELSETMTSTPTVRRYKRSRLRQKKKIDFAVL